MTERVSGPRPPTAMTVAKAAGVSTATVSRTFNDPEKVAPAVRERVRAIAERLGWQPHAAGSALARRRSLIAGALIPTLRSGVFSEHISAMQETFADHGMTLLVGVTNHDPDEQLRQVRAMLARGVDALAIVSQAREDEIHSIVAARGTPHVFTHASLASAPYITIGNDNFRAFHDLTRHLLDLGHRDFGMIVPSLSHNSRVIDRVAGARAALAEAGLAIRPHHVFEGPWSIAFGRQSLRAMLQAGTDKPTAIICGNDQIAFGALAEAADLGLHVPRNLSITGFDDSELAAHTSPPLTSMRIDYAQMGRQTALTLLDMIAGRMTLPPPAIPAVIVARATTAPPPPPASTTPA